jgi:hypothetical protein
MVKKTMLHLIVNSLAINILAMVHLKTLNPKKTHPKPETLT